MKIKSYISRPIVVVGFLIAGMGGVLFLSKISAQNISPEEYLLLVADHKDGDQYGYVNSRGDTVIPFNTYRICYTDTFRTYAVVLSEDKGLIAINRNEEQLFKVFPYDNGPDYPSEGLFRIVRDGKIGYANLQGNIAIEPRFSCAYPFKGGKAKVALKCNSVYQGEHLSWKSNSWFYINKKGKRVRRE